MTLRQPLFILCPGRSFSSVVCAAIGQHPQMFGLPEVNLFIAPTVRDLMDADIPFFGIPGAMTGLRRAVAELMFGVQTEETVNQVNDWLRGHEDWTGARMFEELRKMAAPRALVDKSPTNSQGKALRQLHRAYPDAWYLHLARHPRATCRSRAAAAYRNRRGRQMDTTDLEMLWTRRHRELLDFGRGLAPGQYMYLRGEDFFEDPAPILRQICAWMDLDDAEAAIGAMLHPEDSPFARPGPDNAKNGNNPGFMANPALRIGKIKPESLDDPLEWVEDRVVHFGSETRLLAAILGYDGQDGADEGRQARQQGQSEGGKAMAAGGRT